jgi:glycosyltransferase involved in cell wall biosynthesis
MPSESRNNKVLMIAHVFPPFRSVGHSIRVVKFIKYLPALGWLPVVLTIDDRKEYEGYRKEGSESLLSDIPHGVRIFRTLAGEPSTEYLEKEMRWGRRNWLSSVFGKILGGARRWVFRNLALPDQRVAWLPFAVRKGHQIMRSEGIDVIFATCPPHSATLVGACLKRLTGKPLILDFRDDWIDTPWYHSRPAMIRMIERHLENWVVKTADKVILVTEWSKKAFQDRYPEQPSDKFIFISNGCDLDDIARLNSLTTVRSSLKFTIVHAGSLNDSKNWTREPTALFKAIHQLIQKEPGMEDKLALLFVGDFPERHRKMALEMGLSSVIKGVGHLPHEEVLQLIQSADLLLAMNYDGFSTLIPGKIYEYWAIGGPPILLLSCPGAAAAFIERYKLGFTVDPSDVDAIIRVVITTYLQSKTAPCPRLCTAGIEAFDRRALTQKLAQVLSLACNRFE